MKYLPDSKVHGAKMGPSWGLSAPGGPNVGPINLVIRALTVNYLHISWNVQYIDITVTSIAYTLHIAAIETHATAPNYCAYNWWWNDWHWACTGYITMMCTIFMYKWSDFNSTMELWKNYNCIYCKFDVTINKPHDKPMISNVIWYEFNIHWIELILQLWCLWATQYRIYPLRSYISQFCQHNCGHNIRFVYVLIMMVRHLYHLSHYHSKFP